MDNSTFVTMFKIGDFNSIYARVDWIDNETDLFHIEIYDRRDWWAGRLSNEFAKTYRERAEESEDDYKSNVKDSLMNQQGCVFEFKFTPGDSGLAIFSWKKKFENVTFVHGSVPVHKVSTDHNIDSIIDFLFNENKKLKTLLEDYEANIQLLKEELNQSKSDLTKFLNVKSSLEMSVYGKFVSLLNTKKRRIQVLEDNLHQLEKSDALPSELD